MGQRANYILIEAGKQTIHYNHWRANTVAADLYLGERRFIQFMKDCQLVDQLLDEVWIEGCVIVDVDNKNLSFWAFELAPTSVMEIYLKELFSKWNGWKIDCALQQDDRCRENFRYRLYLQTGHATIYLSHPI
ncbi:MAG: hypothetical protein ABJA76_17540 [Mucilaginibacter sp.]